MAFCGRTSLSAVPWVILPYAANQAGWMAAEVGRQPWIVYGLLRTGDAHSKSVTAPEVWTSLILFTLIYILLFVLFLYVLDRKIRQGPEPVEAGEHPAHPAEEEHLIEAMARRGKTQFSQTQDQSEEG